MSATTRTILSNGVKRSLPRQPLLVSQRRGLAAHVDDETASGAGGTHQAHEHLQGASSKAHHPVSTSLLWGDEFWRNTPAYSNVSKEQFLSYRWSVSDVSNTPTNPPCPYVFLFKLANINLRGKTTNTVDSIPRLHRFLNSVVPDEIPDGAGAQSKEQFIEDIYFGTKAATMSLRITYAASLLRG